MGLLILQNKIFVNLFLSQCFQNCGSYRPPLRSGGANPYLPLPAFIPLAPRGGLPSTAAMTSPITGILRPSANNMGNMFLSALYDTVERLMRPFC
jgi:hypothetical protein